MAKPNKERLEIIILEPNEFPKYTIIKNELSEFQKIVGGLIEVIPTEDKNIVCVLNEEGKLNGLEPNFLYHLGENYYDVVVGTVFFVGDTIDKDGMKEFRSLTDEEIDKVSEMTAFGRHALKVLRERQADEL